ncbi:DnaJ family domain-containing protein [Gracilibacillus dipsosauri]|uniref:DnaJ family domain-containing protein n=1 Tax=Gracilibacillus dipsosauri TaxID=178340 RepID=UPI002409FDBC
MDVFAQLAEERIKKAIEEGEFDQLKGRGKPLKQDDLSHVPEDLRMGYRLLKNSGFLPEELQINKELVTLRDLIKSCDSESEKKRLEKKLTEKELRLRMLIEKRGIKKSPVYRQYRHKLDRLSQR